jgi:hypothetical protein
MTAYKIVQQFGIKLDILNEMFENLISSISIKSKSNFELSGDESRQKTFRSK